ncbi:MAG: phosphoglycerate dehydrogenase, partial [Alphaproteobacteria bacterium]|nr:phosphoglycerate dehydrogenase [Alphaproteobacteria bacterium]
PAATAAGVVVMNTPFGNSITTAEHAIALMFALARQLPAADRSTQAGKWEKSKFMGVELYGKTLGIIGCGNIGSIVADRALGLKMKVVAADPFLSKERATELGVDKVELPELFARADFISLHTPLTDQTRDVINAGSIAKMKKGVRVINCARGGLVVEADLKAGLDSGQVGGAAIDVFPVEPAKENMLFGHPGVICTPHLGASTNEAQENVALQVAEQMSDFLLTGAVVNALNMPSISAEDAPKLQPYMALATHLGALAGQITADAVKAITVEYEGHAASLNTRPLTAAILQGFLSRQMGGINMVNAPIIAKERGIGVTEVKHDRKSDYATMMRIAWQTEGGKHVVCGTLFADHKPRILEIEGVRVEAEFSPSMIYLANEDKPGFIGALGTTLGAAGVNIATLNLGRTGPGGGAVNLVTVDGPIPDDVLKKLRALAMVKLVRPLSF